MKTFLFHVLKNAPIINHDAIFFAIVSTAKEQHDFPNINMTKSSDILVETLYGPDVEPDINRTQIVHTKECKDPYSRGNILPTDAAKNSVKETFADEKQTLLKLEKTFEQEPPMIQKFGVQTKAKRASHRASKSSQRVENKTITRRVMPDRKAKHNLFIDEPKRVRFAEGVKTSS